MFPDHAEDVRWHQRLNNLERAYHLLQEGCNGYNNGEYENNLIAKEGLIQRFEYTAELLKNTMLDFLKSREIELPEVTPKQIFLAFAKTGLHTDVEVLHKLWRDRNMTNHRYDADFVDELVPKIAENHVQVIRELVIQFIWIRKLDGAES
jgi:hypothetical protein